MKTHTADPSSFYAALGHRQLRAVDINESQQAYIRPAKEFKDGWEKETINNPNLS